MRYETYIVYVEKGRYHKTKMCGGVAFEVEVEFQLEVRYHMQIIVTPSPLVATETHYFYGCGGSVSPRTKYSVAAPTLFAAVVLPSSQEKMLILSWYDPPLHHQRIVFLFFPFLFFPFLFFRASLVLHPSHSPPIYPHHPELVSQRRQ